MTRRPRHVWTNLVDLLQSATPLATKLIDLSVQAANQLVCFADGGTKLVWFALPPRNPLDFGGPTAHFCFDLLAKLALGARRDGLHDKLHATGFANSVFLGTVLSEVTPLPIATGKAVLVVEAHVSGCKSWEVLVSDAARF